VRRRTDLKHEDGVAMTEFALILPVFLFIVVGLLAFGRVFFYWIQANHLASETARWAIVDRNPYAPDGASPPGAGGKTLQQQAADSSTVEFKGGVDLGDPVRVRVEKPFTPIPFLKVATITIRGSSTMRIERFANNVDPSAYTDAQNIGTCS
jgi:hypothetical protein